MSRQIRGNQPVSGAAKAAPRHWIPGLTRALYAGNALWYTSALTYFGFRQPHMMRKLSTRRTSSDPAVRHSPAGDAWHRDFMACLGGLNSSLAVLAALRVYALARPSRVLGGNSVALGVTALAVLDAANLSQAFVNFTVSRAGDRWIMGKGWDRITVLDALFTVLDLGAAVARVVGAG
ncbi:hypothetical protein F4810DRAFT_706056 [Camillea tinctor]|nr:hypothetical protein F4810DRAFT_706056 [Camillea tinctor]